MRYSYRLTAHAVTSTTSSHPTPLRCAEHPDVETYLRCGKCDTPICPRCMVQTPVGARCKQCARLRPPVVEQVPMPLFARATAAGVGSALAVGLLWGVIPSFGFFGFLIAGGVGYLIGEAMTRAANRRRSRPLLAVACGCVVLAYLLSLVAPLLLSSGLAGIERLPVALGRLLPALLANPFAWIPPIIGAFTATTRFR